MKASEIIRLQAEHHPIEQTSGFEREEDACLYLMHLRAYSEAARLSTGLRVLDIGCNLGYGSGILSESAANVVGVDVSEMAIQKARQMVQKPNASFLRVNGGILPFEEKEFDIITAFQLIEHLPDPVPFLADVWRVLKPGGRFLLTTPNASIRLDPGMKPWNEFHVHEYMASELTALLKTRFPKVAVSGLFADNELYEIERNRVERQRKNARRITRHLPPWWKVRSSLIRSGKTLLPSQVVGKLRNLISHKANFAGSSTNTPASKVDRAKNLLLRYGAEDFFYRSTDLDIALDFLADCQK